jgi:hypothetical protein
MCKNENTFRKYLSKTRREKASTGFSPNQNVACTYTLRCEKIASMLFFVAFFRRFVGIIQVARLAICNIRKCSERFIIFNGANSFPIEQF